MPFDGRLNDATTAWARGKDYPSLRALVYVLRDQTTWPQGFRWDYGDCETCALGLARLLWQNGSHPDDFDSCDLNDDYKSWASLVFDMEESAVEDIFFGEGDCYPDDFALIRPADVAAAIERHLAAR
jgi:hypothetical protein